MYPVECHLETSLLMEDLCQVIPLVDPAPAFSKSIYQG